MSSPSRIPVPQAAAGDRSAAARARNRVQAGVRNGGEFAVEARTEAAVDLLEPADPLASRNADLVDLAIADNGAALGAQALLSARHVVNIRGIRYVTPDDLAQDTIEQVLRYRKAAIDRGDAPRVATGAYLQTIASGFGAHAARGALRQEDHKAIGMFTKQVADLEATENRHLTRAERDEIAETIWRTWPDPRHKPHRDFVQLANQVTLSLDRNSGTGRRFADEIADEIVAPTDGPSSEGAEYAKAMDLAEAGRKADARRQVWNAVAELNGAPAVNTRISRARQLTHRQAISAAGGVAQVVSHWNRTGVDTPATEALFAPFGDIDVDGKDAVADLLSRNRDRAEELYSAALLAAAALPSS